jgi:hypothetical protein
MSISNEFVECIKKYVLLDDQIKETTELLKNIRSQKTKLSSYITKYIEQNNIQSKDINLSDGKIKYYISKSQSSMSRKYIEERLAIYFKDIDKARDCTEFLYANREYTERGSIRRTKYKN